MKNSKKIFSLVITFIVVVVSLYTFCECKNSNVSRIDEPVDSTMTDSVVKDSVVFDSTTVAMDTMMVDSVK